MKWIKGSKSVTGSASENIRKTNQMIAKITTNETRGKERMEGFMNEYNKMFGRNKTKKEATEAIAESNH